MNRGPENDGWLAAIRALPDGGAITLPAAVARRLTESAHSAASPPALFTVVDLARHFQVSPSTARAWCAAGRCPGAFQLSRLGWRVPADALPAIEQHLRQQPDVTDLGAWRRGRKAA